jgi:hypothetical protein
LRRVSSLPMRQRERVRIAQSPQRYGRRVDHQISALERAFQIARSGRATNVDDIRKQLKEEGYDQRALDGGPSLKSQLRELIKAAHLDRGAPKG